MRGSREEGSLIVVFRRLESILISTIKEYFSPQNLKILLFMILSVIPAAICHAFYISSRILCVEGFREIFFFRIDYMHIDQGYDFIITPLSILIALNFGLILMKFAGKIFKEKNLFPDSRNILMKFREKTLKEENLALNSEKLIYIVVACSVIVVLYFYKSLLTSHYGSLLTLLFIPIIIFLYSLKKIFSKIIIFPLLLLFNISFFIISSQPFLPGEIINEGISHFPYYLARIGVSSLYILPYNFFFFFPLIIGIYFYDFRYPEKYLSSFFDVVFHENMVAVFVGLLLCMIFSFTSLFIVMPQLPPDFVPYHLPIDVFGRMIVALNKLLAGVVTVDLEIFRILAIFHLWVGSFVLWFTPFVVSLTQLETKFEANFDRRLREIIQKMREHIVVIGFGNLGKKVCTDLIERGVISRKDDTVEIFTPDLEVQKICKSLLIVDVDDQLFDRVHTDPVLQNIGVARRKIIIAGKKEDILIPAIIGDINSETTRDSSRLKDSRLFISAPSDYRATFTLSKFANREDLDSIISVEDSAQKDYFSPKITAHDTFLIYPAFQEGIALGRITSLCYLRLEEEQLEYKKSKNPEIIIAGEGKQIHYLMETFWMEMKRVGIATSWVEQKKETGSSSDKEGRYRLPISILTDSEELKRRSKPKKGELDEKKKEINEIIKRSAHIHDGDAYLLFDVIFDAPDRLKTIEEIIREKEPQIIVITSNTIQKVTKIFHEWVVGVERHISAKNKNYKPVIIVGIRGDEYEEIKDILLYYTKMDPDSGLKYPTQYIDAVVRAYDDSQEQIGGLVQSLVRKDSQDSNDKKNRKIKDPFALYCCMEDVPGILGDLLGRLAGIKFRRVNSSDTDNVISLHFCRFQRCPGVENYSFLANAEIYKEYNIKVDENLLFCLFQSKSGDPERTRKSIKNLLNTKSIMEVLSENPDSSELPDICFSCGRRITCSIASYLRKVENLIKNREYYEHLEKLGKFKRKEGGNEKRENKKSIVDRELERFFANPNFHISSTIREQENRDLPKASILVCCRHSKVTGSLSTTVNNLLFKEIEEMYEEDVVDTTYLRSHECYDPVLTNIEFYGNLVNIRKDKREFLMKRGPIDSVFIDVVTKKDAWLDYAKNLCEALNDSYEDTYQLWVDNSKSPYYIAVIRKEFVEGNDSKEISITCKRQECTIHDKMRLLKKKLI
jgi:hypothetical protein